jgi:hypothetical protein
MVKSHVPKGVPLLTILKAQSLKRAVAFTFLTFVLAIIAVRISHYSLPLSYRGGPTDSPPNGLKVKLEPSTFALNVNQPFSIQAIGDFDPVCDRIDAKIPDQEWNQSFTRTQLVNGAQGEWNPNRTGTYRMEFFCKDRVMGDTGVSVVSKSPQSGDLTPPTVRWVLSHGKPIYRENSFFEIPIIASCEVRSGSSFVSHTVNEDIYLNLFDRNGQIRDISPLKIQQHTAISQPVYLPFPIGADYRLVAYEKEQGQSSNELALTWNQLAPPLSLVAYPNSVELYSAGLSSSAVQLYLTSDSRQIKPADTTQILFAAPSAFKSDPADAITLSPTKPVGTYRLSSPTQPGDWNVSFQEPRLGVKTIATVKVLPIYTFVILAMVAGLVGVLVARRTELFAQSKVAIIIEILSALGAAFLLYTLLLTGWIDTLKRPEFILSYFGAIAIGVIGGYVGLGVFQLAKRVIIGESTNA